MLPKYRGVSAGTLIETFPVSVGGYTRDAGFFEAPLPDGARALLVDCPDLYDRDALYAPLNIDYPDNAMHKMTRQSMQGRLTTRMVIASLR